MLYSNLADIDSEEDIIAKDEGTAGGPDPAEGGAETNQDAGAASAGVEAMGERRGKREKGHRRGGQGAGASASSSAGASLSSHVRIQQIRGIHPTLPPLPQRSHTKPAPTYS